MKALTICPPFSHLVCLPDTHPEHKRIENRVWYTRHRGQLAIHAGKGRSWLARDPMRPGYDLSGFRIADMHFGSVVAIADMVDCIEIYKEHDVVIPVKPLPAGLEWMLTHQHSEGPWCWVLQNVRLLAKPVQVDGAQGLWNWNPTKMPELLPVNAMPTPTQLSKMMEPVEPQLKLF